jgi:hypothetical protein
VLRPIQRYVSQLASISGDANREPPLARGVIMASIVGVNDNGAAVYSDGGPPHADFVVDFGIGPGCTSGAGADLQRAVPPVRIKRLVEEFDGNLFSVCKADYSSALAIIAEQVMSATSL